MLFLDRRDAGRQLLDHLWAFRGPDVVVLGIARGGVAVAHEIAMGLRVALDVIVVHELHTRGGPDRVVGAIAEHGVPVTDDDTADSVTGGHAELARIEQTERDRLRRRAEYLRCGRPSTSLIDRTAVIVADAVQTAAVHRAACRSAYAQGAVRVVFAAPVGRHRVIHALAADADNIVCPHIPPQLATLDGWYQHFAPLTDTDVGVLLQRTASPRCRIQPRHPENGVAVPPRAKSAPASKTPTAEPPDRSDDLAIVAQRFPLTCTVPHCHWGL
ncbi:phosphoribosyltransferase [Nocardia jejuensis]|uniref:phosphoribosyltransferase n=1 Tax=Nocardia jejuensis TaxID=328049 RepID=UPI00082E2D9F|nr:phosphoribosyltransferase family protein [Nocardia jejuensis]